MDFVKKNKKAVIIGTIVVVFLIVLFLFLRLFLVDVNKDEYGNRLDGIDKVEISKNAVSKLKEEMAALSEVDNIDYRLQGRLIYISLKMASGVSKDTAKEIAAKTLDYFTEDEKKYYDIQVIITTSDENAEYPIIGYKHKTSTEFVW